MTTPNQPDQPTERVVFETENGRVLHSADDGLTVDIPQYIVPALFCFDLAREIERLRAEIDKLTDMLVDRDATFEYPFNPGGDSE